MQYSVSLARVAHVVAVAGLAFSMAVGVAYADGLKRTELKRVDLTGQPETEVITSELEAAPGATIPRHTHHGDEFVYVLQGGMIQVPGREPMEMKAGQVLHFPRGVPHGGFTVIGDTPLKAITTHVVDKGKPLVVPVE